MPLKDIRTFLQMRLQGDETIEARLDMMKKQREVVKARMKELQQTLDTLDFKCWYYETAREAGTTEVPKNMTLDELPELFRDVRKRLRPSADGGQGGIAPRPGEEARNAGVPIRRFRVRKQPLPRRKPTRASGLRPGRILRSCCKHCPGHSSPAVQHLSAANLP